MKGLKPATRQGNGSQGNNESSFRAMTPDARDVAFTSFANNLVPGDSNGATDVFVKDRQTGAIERISVAADGLQAIRGDSWGGGLTSDGRYVAFISNANNLVPGDTNGLAYDVFVKDRQTGAIE